jgi:hypothetical protein
MMVDNNSSRMRSIFDFISLCFISQGLSSLEIDCRSTNHHHSTWPLWWYWNNSNCGCQMFTSTAIVVSLHRRLYRFCQVRTGGETITIWRMWMFKRYMYRNKLM